VHLLPGLWALLGVGVGRGNLCNSEASYQEGGNRYRGT